MAVENFCRISEMRSADRGGAPNTAAPAAGLFFSPSAAVAVGPVSFLFVASRPAVTMPPSHLILCILNAHVQRYYFFFAFTNIYRQGRFYYFYHGV
jgi:hypothetical protein